VAGFKLFGSAGKSGGGSGSGGGFWRGVVQNALGGLLSTALCALAAAPPLMVLAKELLASVALTV